MRRAIFRIAALRVEVKGIVRNYAFDVPARVVGLRPPLIPPPEAHLVQESFDSPTARGIWAGRRSLYWDASFNIDVANDCEKGCLGEPDGTNSNDRPIHSGSERPLPGLGLHDPNCRGFWR